MSRFIIDAARIVQAEAEETRSVSSVATLIEKREPAVHEATCLSVTSNVCCAYPEMGEDVCGESVSAIISISTLRIVITRRASEVEVVNGLVQGCVE